MTRLEGNENGGCTDTDRTQQGHEHSMAHRGAWVWLPTQDCEHLAPHPFCTDCGQVRAVGSARALDRGGLVNLLASLRRLLERDGHCVTDVQRRLIMKRIEELEADDAFSLTRDRQLELVTETVAKILYLRPETVSSYLRIC